MIFMTYVNKAKSLKEQKREIQILLASFALLFS